MKFRKKPIVIEAIKWLGDWQEISDWCDRVSDGNGTSITHFDGYICIKTLEGNFFPRRRDWIICGIEGEFYCCKPDIFEKTYEAVEGPDELESMPEEK